MASRSEAPERYDPTGGRRRGTGLLSPTYHRRANRRWRPHRGTPEVPKRRHVPPSTPIPIPIPIPMAMATPIPIPMPTPIPTPMPMAMVMVMVIP
jgi:hypothetical protein